jgi:hypothetical protein
MVGAHALHTATLLTDGRVLVAGMSEPFTTTTEIFDPISRTFTAAAPMLQDRYAHTATLLVDGRVLAIGGAAGRLPTVDRPDVAYASAEIFDPKTAAWIATDPPDQRLFHTATLLADGRVLVVGGAIARPSGAPLYLSSTLLFDPTTLTFGKGPSMAEARGAHTATLLPGGRVLVSGGYRNGALSTAEIFDPSANAWLEAAPMAVARYAHSATVLPDQRILVAGGNGPTSLSSAEIYDPASGAWSPTDDLQEARAFHTSTLLMDGRVLLAGGATPDELSTAELFFRPCTADGLRVLDPHGPEKSCSPYRCVVDRCEDRCASASDCVAPFVCNAGARCVAPSEPIAASGCEFGRATPSGGFGTVAVMVALLRRRHRRRHHDRGSRNE